MYMCIYIYTYYIYICIQITWLCRIRWCKIIYPSIIIHHHPSSSIHPSSRALPLHHSVTVRNNESKHAPGIPWSLAWPYDRKCMVSYGFTVQFFGCVARLQHRHARWSQRWIFSAPKVALQCNRSELRVKPGLDSLWWIIEIQAYECFSRQFLMNGTTHIRKSNKSAVISCSMLLHDAQWCPVARHQPW